jgi:hypothetical protein
MRSVTNVQLWSSEFGPVEFDWWFLTSEYPRRGREAGGFLGRLDTVEALVEMPRVGRDDRTGRRDHQSNPCSLECGRGS